MITGYGLIYTTEIEGLNNLKSRFLIYQRDTSDSNTDTVASSDPITTFVNGDRSAIYKNTIVATQVNMTIKADTLLALIDFAESDEEKYLGVRMHWNGSSWEEKFRGFMSSDFYSQNYDETETFVSLQFMDRLSSDDLSAQPYATESLLSKQSSNYTGKQTILNTLSVLLKRLHFEMSGFKIASTYFESNHDSAATDTAFAQTYVNVESYYDFNDNGKLESSMSIQEVIKALLGPFASLYAYEGYYWIIQQDLLQGSSFNYVEYDMDGVYVANSSRSNSVSFKASGSSIYWRWVESQTLSYTPIYKTVNLTLNGNIIEEGLTPLFIGKNSFKLGVLGHQSFLEFSRGTSVTKTIGNTMASGHPSIFDYDRLVDYTADGVDIPDRLPLIWAFVFDDYDNSSTFLFFTEDITYEAKDRLLTTIKIHVRPSFSSGLSEPLLNFAPYYTLKWKLKVGSYYYVYSTETWSLTDTTNSYFITELAEDLEIEFNAILRAVASSTTETMELSVFCPTFAEYDLSSDSEANMVTALKAVTTTSLSDGHRSVTRYSKTLGYQYYFYELLENQESGSEPDVVQPTDYHATTNPVRWRLVESNYIYRDNSTTEFKGLDVHFLPEGDDPPDSVTISKTANSANILELETSLFHFDFPAEVNTSEKIYKNILFYSSDGGITFTPTSEWTDGTDTFKIQNHRLNWILKNVKRARQRIMGGKIWYDVDIAPFASLLDSASNNRRYILPNVTYDHKGGMISGDFVEIGSDDTVTTRAYSTGYSKGFS